MSSSIDHATASMSGLQLGGGGAKKENEPRNGVTAPPQLAAKGDKGMQTGPKAGATSDARGQPKKRTRNRNNRRKPRGRADGAGNGNGTGNGNGNGEGNGNGNPKTINTNNKSGNANNTRNTQPRRRNGARKPKNTTDFKPNFAKPDLRLVYGSPRKAHAPPLTVHDVIYVPELFADEDDMTLYDQLLEELKGGDTDEKLFQLWHGDSHVIANDRVRRGVWKQESSAFQRIINRMEDYFQMKIAATRLNWYRPGTTDWKPFHHDRAAFTAGVPQNLTVAASIGPDCRTIGFQHAGTGTSVHVAMPNGSAYAFARDVNCEWKHGVIAEKEPARGRVSIIAWGLAEQETTGSRITENDVPTASDLGLA